VLEQVVRTVPFEIAEKQEGQKCHIVHFFNLTGKEPQDHRAAGSHRCPIVKRKLSKGRIDVYNKT